MKLVRSRYPYSLQEQSGRKGSPLSLLLCFFIFLLWSPQLSGQSNTVADSLDIQAERTAVDTSSVKIHSPHKASIYSMILPGLGQAYNKKYWKIPIIYAGFGVFYYLIDYNATEYNLWKDAYYHTLLDPDGLEDPVNEYEELYGDNPDFMRDRKDDARRYRDLNWILAGVWYLLNVLDATVDAHLFSWNVDDNLTLRVEPHIHNQVRYQKPTGGIKFSLRF